ncbi:hypothetical protein B0H21DRAFT_55556 [Amylocystis lapponica]|nr:hypothetical protein B0H21DRAFT_55556 [Amylocystis lapponica]
MSGLVVSIRLFFLSFFFSLFLRATDGLVVQPPAIEQYLVVSRHTHASTVLDCSLLSGHSQPRPVYSLLPPLTRLCLSFGYPPLCRPAIRRISSIATYPVSPSNVF